jgi:hypothetical protein
MPFVFAPCREGRFVSSRATRPEARALSSGPAGNLVPTGERSDARLTACAVDPVSNAASTRSASARFPTGGTSFQDTTTVSSCRQTLKGLESCLAEWTHVHRHLPMAPRERLPTPVAARWPDPPLRRDEPGRASQPTRGRRCPRPVRPARPHSLLAGQGENC